MRFCKEHGIRFSGQKLGRPLNNIAIQKAIKKQWREDERIRNAVEGKFGEGNLALQVFAYMRFWILKTGILGLLIHKYSLEVFWFSR